MFGFYKKKIICLSLGDHLSLITLLIKSDKIHQIISSKFSTRIFPLVALGPNAGQNLLILEVSRSHTTTHHSRVSLL